MQTFKPSGTELVELQATASSLKAANETLSKATKAVEAAKESLTKWLSEERKLDLSSLKIGDMVVIEEVVLIEVGKMRKFDDKRFLLEEPGIHGSYMKDFTVKRFKPIS